jgi:hypothetical protein
MAGMARMTITRLAVEGADCRGCACERGPSLRLSEVHQCVLFQLQIRYTAAAAAGGGAQLWEGARTR